MGSSTRAYFSKGPKKNAFSLVFKLIFFVLNNVKYWKLNIKKSLLPHQNKYYKK